MGLEEVGTVVVYCTGFDDIHMAVCEGKNETCKIATSIPMSHCYMTRKLHENVHFGFNAADDAATNPFYFRNNGFKNNGS